LPCSHRPAGRYEKSMKGGEPQCRVNRSVN